MTDDLDQRPEDGQSPALTWRDGVPVATAFEDPYFSVVDGLAETRHVFLAGNGLPGRFRPGFHIAELGFGTGLNCLAAWAAWRAAGVSGALRFTSFEAFPMVPADMARALTAFPGVADLAERLLEGLRNDPEGVQTPDLDLRIVVGDARRTLPKWNGRADAWFLDGFAPARNPELWGADLMAAVGAHTAPGGTVATYTAAGHVRRSLAAAGFDVTRVAGFGTKRHMTTGSRA